MPDYFDIGNYINITNDNQIKSLYIIKFDNPEMMQQFIDYLNDIIKYSVSYELPFKSLLSICNILVEDSQFKAGRSIIVWLSRATWVYSDDSAADECIEGYNVIHWSNFRQWQDYIQPMIDLLSNSSNKSTENNYTNLNPTDKHACNCGSTDLHVDYLQLSLPSGLAYQYSVVCQLCGQRGPKSDTEIGAIDAWNDFVSNPNIKSNFNNVSLIDFINNVPKCKHCDRPLILTEGANYCIYCGERINLYGYE